MWLDRPQHIPGTYGIQIGPQGNVSLQAREELNETTAMPPSAVSVTSKPQNKILYDRSA